ncbi:hypothetical protein NLX83_03860 [Allokutzneria sp. A3M-2-11 16]|uniref:hypothetical protein n=1 Tax=Allokutzneria sp. A3M-2-11 16 TaxID=2962043 RepID=UPI0020B6AF68|nr:hypothetical protein [Allokutzneria sp. A3M-2-11 16]MCP3798388.1 hypothetical protein [Allokutzneria sp. A3M-2-11 16]
MNTAAKLSAYGAALALVAAGAWAAGSAVGPFAAPAGAHSDAPGAGGTPGGGNAGHGDGHGGTVAEAAQTDQPGGLASSRGGYTLAPTATTLRTGAAQTFAFRVFGPDGKPVTRFDVEHEKRMHLIVIRRDTAGFQHVHPELDPYGTWRVPLTLPRAGSYRVFADFAPTGAKPLTLGVDVSAAGDFQPETYQASRVSTVDGYEVRLDGELVPGRSSKLTLTVKKDGRDIADLQPYLGAYGHLVALRSGDLAYLHVHPDGSPGDGKTAAGPKITFFAEVPTEGSYRLFLDFQHAGQVRTAEFTVNSHASHEEGGPHGH